MFIIKVNKVRVVRARHMIVNRKNNCLKRIHTRSIKPVKTDFKMLLFQEIYHSIIPVEALTTCIRCLLRTYSSWSCSSREKIIIGFVQLNMKPSNSLFILCNPIFCISQVTFSLALEKQLSKYRALTAFI
jgi:hypothetical protein